MAEATNLTIVFLPARDRREDFHELILDFIYTTRESKLVDFRLPRANGLPRNFSSLSVNLNPNIFVIILVIILQVLLLRHRADLWKLINCTDISQYSPSIFLTSQTFSLLGTAKYNTMIRKKAMRNAGAILSNLDSSDLTVVFSVYKKLR